MGEKIHFIKSLPVKIFFLSIGLFLIAGAGFYVWWLLNNKPKAERKQPIALIPKVQVEELKEMNIQVEIPAMGVVIPSQEATIRSRVSGEIIKLHDELEPGGILQKDEPIIWLDDADYKLQVKMKEAELKKAESALQLELVQQRIAESQFKSYSNRENNDKLDMDMILRKPHERSKRADIQAAESDLKDAELDLARTVVSAPFNAVVLDKVVDIGEQADLQRVLVTLAGVDSFWIRVSVPVTSLKWITFPSRDNHNGSQVTVKSRRGTRTGRVLRLYTQLESQGRMAQILIEVKDPLCLESPNGSSDIPLLIGEYVNVTIMGKELKNVVEIPRKAYRDNARVWIMTPEHKLDIIEVKPVWDIRDAVYVAKSELPAGKVIVSDLGFPVKNMALSAVLDSNVKQTASNNEEAITTP